MFCTCNANNLSGIIFPETCVIVKLLFLPLHAHYYHRPITFASLLVNHGTLIIVPCIQFMVYTVNVIPNVHCTEHRIRGRVQGRLTRMWYHRLRVFFFFCNLFHNLMLFSNFQYLYVYFLSFTCIVS